MYQSILDFWFVEIPQTSWWQKDLDFDKLIEKRFGALHQQAIANELHTWRSHAAGCLAEIIILDQFSRNIYRDQPDSFSWDSQALALAQIAIEKGFDAHLTAEQCKFLYMPFMHSESLAIHNEAVKLFTKLKDENTLDFELQHKAIIEKFGRYPHRNKVLNRASTPEELKFLEGPNSGF